MEVFTQWWGNKKKQNSDKMKENTTQENSINKEEENAQSFTSEEWSSLGKDNLYN